ncbi:hypothetical protein [Paraburkholderia sp. BL10I2N1]|uniref:hypothetical protein n=1 Tax=Paraburkholderia sp. BL10I2N1 TaxID=1938796 RepID=UPI00105FE276|nr:hypothetical protein [Paraburkholderia sp. BL10I2N1]TDN70447.1 hypothetical protein B0G77_3921 [Paraburkholderia sp. BL10I2N1]
MDPVLRRFTAVDWIGVIATVAMAFVVAWSFWMRDWIGVAALSISLAMWTFACWRTYVRRKKQMLEEIFNRIM